MRFNWLLDNGHGDNTPGKRSPKLNGKTLMFEYEFNRAVVERIRLGLIERNINHTVLVPEITDISLEERVRRANILAARTNCILMSIHGNAHEPNGVFDWNSANGIEVFTTKGQTKSDRVAEVLITELDKATGLIVIRKDISDGDSDKEADHYITRKVTCPAILSENGFMTNLEECKRMLTPAYRQQIADAHIKTIEYFEKHGI